MTTATPALVIDASRAVVMLDGRPVHLQRKQHKLLNLLASDPTRCFTQDQLSRGLWGDSFERRNALRSQMSRLRNALGGQFVFNVHSVGYRLVQPDQAGLVEIVRSAP